MGDSDSCHIVSPTQGVVATIYGIEEFLTSELLARILWQLDHEETGLCAHIAGVRSP